MDVSVDRLVVDFGTVCALDGVSLDLRAGQVAVLAGPNGAGKSTLLSVLLGLIAPDRGEVRVNGRVVASKGRHAALWVREHLGYLPESVHFSENLSGRQVLRFFALARGIKFSQVEDTLDRIGLSRAAGRRVVTYSRGMRQRLGLGVAILSNPELLVLDEPTGGLDQQGLALLWEVLDEWRAAGRMVVMSSHELALVERRADRVHVLVDGKLRASGTPPELREQSGLPTEMRIGPGLDEVYDELVRRATWDVSELL
ncbi:MAG: Cu-processing system ATP-binding protein [Myxococcota bacterium]|jgi:Cu-processing system ATP-binding protein